MGLKMSKATPPLSESIAREQSTNNACNYDCPVCVKSGKIPNISGKFFIINDNECKCNACNTIFPKSMFYKKIIQGEAL